MQHFDRSMTDEEENTYYRDMTYLYSILETKWELLGNDITSNWDETHGIDYETFMSLYVTDPVWVGDILQYKFFDIAVNIGTETVH